MRFSKILILFIVGFLVFGSLGLLGYTLFIKPYKTQGLFSFLSLKKNHARKQPSVTQSSVPDVATVDFQNALTLQYAGKLTEAQAAWQTWLTTYPNTPKKKEALLQLGKINMELFSNPPSNTSENYSVVKGDSLDRIARKKKSNPDLIQQLNHLPNINLQIGEILFVPQLNTSLEINREDGLLILKNNNQFLKCYALLSCPPQGNKKVPAQKTRVIDCVATVDKKRIAFGNKKYAQSDRIILLGSCSSILTPPKQETKPTSEQGEPNTVTPTMPPGFVISVEDMKELFPFVTKETSVTIN